MVVSLDANTIAFDLTYLHTLKAKIRSLSCLDVGFRFDTILKSLQNENQQPNNLKILFLLSMFADMLNQTQ